MLEKVPVIIPSITVLQTHLAQHSKSFTKLDLHLQFFSGVFRIWIKVYIWINQKWKQHGGLVVTKTGHTLFILNVQSNEVVRNPWKKTIICICWKRKIHFEKLILPYLSTDTIDAMLHSKRHFWHAQTMMPEATSILPLEHAPSASPQPLVPVSLNITNEFFHTFSQ